MTRKKQAKRLSVLTLAFFLMLVMAAIPGQASQGPNRKFIAKIEAVEEGSIPIANRAGLEKIGNHPDYPLDGKYHLTASIDLGGKEWEPIGSLDFELYIHPYEYENATANSFKGIFDGQGHVIRNMTITGERQCAGLFGVTSGDVMIKNLGIEGTSIQITSNNKIASYAGAVIAANCSISLPIVDNCYNTGSISISSTADDASSNIDVFAGGIIGALAYGGSNRNGVVNSYNTGNITATSAAAEANAVMTYAGGIVGGGGYIVDCYNTGNISAFAAYKGTRRTWAHYARAGGIVAESGSMQNCYNTGDITATASENSTYAYAAGIIAQYAGPSTMENCYNTGNISASARDNPAFAGGLAGEFRAGSPIYNSYNAGNVSASSEYKAGAGGICGTSYRSSATGDNQEIGNAYWNTDADQIENGVSSDKRGVGELGASTHDTTIPLTSAQMKEKESFEGFDFNNIWIIQDGGNGGYPALRFGSGKSVVIQSSNEDNAAINLTQESLELPDGFAPVAYSIDGGKKWKTIKFNKKTNEFMLPTDDKYPFNSSTSKGKNNLEKLLNKECELWIVDKYNTKTVKE
ncbi:MAG: hypothetical protein FWH04_07855, partial [Oscillospiraceae bacterium]|nr:hypothetical protein [Oscillospiraceae bacterium]